MNRTSKIMITTSAVVCVIAAVVIPNLIPARRVPSAAPCIINLRQIQSAKQQWAIENNKTTNDAPDWKDVLPYFRGGMPHCPSGGTYFLGKIGEQTRCSIGGPIHTLAENPN